jgi:hypothetical protein
VVVIDKAPWHRGRLLNEVMAAYPHLELYPLPCYSPQLQVIERFWKILRMDFTLNMVATLMQQSCTDMSEEEKQQFEAQVVEKVYTAKARE